MKIGASGVPVGGVGGSGVFVANQRIKDGGTATTDGSRVFYQSADGKVRSCALDGSDDHLVLDMGASLIVAGGGHWTVWLAGAGLVTSWGLTLADAAPMAMTDTGDLLVLISYSTGKGLALYRAGTAAWARPDADPIIRYPYPQAFALDADRVVWANPAGQLFTRGLPAPAQCTAAVFDPFLLDAPDGVWVGYHTDDGRCVVHPLADASKGYIVATGDTYGTTATGNFVGYSRTPSESEMVVVPIDWSAELVSLALPVPVAIAPNVAAKLVVGAWGTLPETPGNLSIGPDDTKAVICTIGEVGQIDPSRLLALFTSDSDIAQNRQAAEDLNVPLAVYVDDRDYLARLPAILDAVGETSWIAILQCYIDCRGREGERLDGFGPSVLAQAVGLAVPWIAAIRCTTPSVNGIVVTPVDRVIAAMNALVPIVALQRCLGWALFKWNRGDGVTGVPALKPAAEAWLTGHPQLQPNQAREWARSLFKEPPVSEPIPAPVQATIRAFHSQNPLPQGPADSESWQDTALRHLPNGWIARLAQQLAFSHGGDWGQKRRGPGAPISAGRIARREPGGFRDWDILTAAASGRPTLTLSDESVGVVTDQEWVAVTPFNHLEEQNSDHAPWPATAMHGVSGFDVAARVHGGDFSYYDETAPLPLNVFVYTTIDNPQTHRLGRTFVEGLAQTETLLKKLTADGRQAMFIMICGPATVNNGPKPTRVEILDMVRQQIDLFLRYAKAVLAVSLGNELYQGFEPPELLDSRLWAEVKALIPRQFVFAVGQVGESAVFGPGSVAMMHPDRGKSSAEALQILADARDRDGRVVVAREPARIEAGGSGQSRGDIAFVREELDNAKRLKIPYFLHLAAGRGAFVPAMDSVQREALAMIKKEAETVTPPTEKDPILDQNMNDNTPWYRIFVNRHSELRAAITEELKRVGKVPTEELILHYLYRASAERNEWVTMRNAIAEKRV